MRKTAALITILSILPAILSQFIGIGSYILEYNSFTNPNVIFLCKATKAQMDLGNWRYNNLLSKTSYFGTTTSFETIDCTHKITLKISNVESARIICPGFTAEDTCEDLVIESKAQSTELDCLTGGCINIDYTCTDDINQPMKACNLNCLEKESCERVRTKCSGQSNGGCKVKSTAALGTPAFIEYNTFSCNFEPIPGAIGLPTCQFESATYNMCERSTMNQCEELKMICPTYGKCCNKNQCQMNGVSPVEVATTTATSSTGNTPAASASVVPVEVTTEAVVVDTRMVILVFEWAVLCESGMMEIQSAPANLRGLIYGLSCRNKRFVCMTGKCKIMCHDAESCADSLVISATLFTGMDTITGPFSVFNNIGSFAQSASLGLPNGAGSEILVECSDFESCKNMVVKSDAFKTMINNEERHSCANCDIQCPVCPKVLPVGTAHGDYLCEVKNQEVASFSNGMLDCGGFCGKCTLYCPSNNAANRFITGFISPESFCVGASQKCPPLFAGSSCKCEGGSDCPRIEYFTTPTTTTTTTTTAAAVVVTPATSTVPVTPVTTAIPVDVVPMVPVTSATPVTTAAAPVGTTAAATTAATATTTVAGAPIGIVNPTNPVVINPMPTDPMVTDPIITLPNGGAAMDPSLFNPGLFQP